MTTTYKDAASEHRMHTSTPGASCAPNCPQYATTTTDPSTAPERAAGRAMASMTPAALARLILEKRAEMGALQDELNKVCRQAGRALTGPVADALTEIIQGLDALYMTLQEGTDWATVRVATLEYWSETAGTAIARTIDRNAQAVARAVSLTHHDSRTPEHPCLACGRFPCACDLMSTHVD